MKAVVKTAKAPGHLALLDRPEPAAVPGGVVIEVAYAGICGTDVHILHDEHPYWPPVTLGHEFTGRVTSVGEGVDRAWVGERVVSEPHAGACGTCHLCRRGHVQLCASKRSPGWGTDGGFASHVGVPAHLLHRVPDAVDDRTAATTEPLAICLSALARTTLDPGSTVVVTGPGPIGLLSAMACRAMGAGRVLLVGRASSRDRLATARGQGFDTAEGHDESLEWTRTVTHGSGADLVVETTGAGEAIDLGLAVLRRRGRMVAIGVGGQPDIPVAWDTAVFKALDIAFSFSSRFEAWDGALALLASGAVATAELTTVFPLEKWQQAIAAVEGRTAMKVLLRPGDGNDAEGER